jgi:hypothetical protein
MRHVIASLPLIVALLALVLFYAVMYLPESVSPFHGHRSRVAVAGLGLLLTGAGMVLRQGLGQPGHAMPDREG